MISSPFRTMPTLPLRDLALPRRKPSLPEQLDRPNLSLWFSARTALWQAVKRLGLSAGDRIALPAFCCGSEVDVFIEAGLEPRYYRCRPTLEPDMESFAAALNEASAAMIVHYFGFAQDVPPLKAMCQKRGIPLIEDCAHALYAADETGWLGAQADVAVFSLWKTLALPDGGALLMNRGADLAGTAPHVPSCKGTMRRTRSLVVRGWRAHPNAVLRGSAQLPAWIKARLGMASGGVDLSDPKTLDDAARFHHEYADMGMSRCAARLLMTADHNAIRSIRRERYRRLCDAISDQMGARPLFRELPKGACPLFLPIVVDQPKAFQQRLAQKGYAAKHIWSWFHPAVPWDRFPLEADLKRSVFGLPVHQALRDREVERFAACLRDWKA